MRRLLYAYFIDKDEQNLMYIVLKTLTTEDNIYEFFFLVISHTREKLRVLIRKTSFFFFTMKYIFLLQYLEKCTSIPNCLTEGMSL